MGGVAIAEVPEEVVIALEADDRATPTLTGVGRSLVLLGSNIAYVTRELGIQNPVLTGIINAILFLGHVVRAASAAQRLLATANAILTGTQVAGTAATAGQAAVTGAYTGAAATATAVNYGLAASFRAVMAAMGPIGWALLAIGLIGAGVAGYALGGGFAPRPAAGMPTLGEGPFQEPKVSINIQNANFQTKQAALESVQKMGTLWFEQMRRYR